MPGVKQSLGFGGSGFRGLGEARGDGGTQSEHFGGHRRAECPPVLQTWHPSAPHVPSSVWAGGRGTGRKFPICSAPILASPFVSLAICPAAPRAPRSRCTCRKYQDGLCLCFKRLSGPRATASSAWQPQKCRGLAWPGGSVVPLPPLLSFFFVGSGFGEHRLSCALLTGCL